MILAKVSLLQKFISYAVKRFIRLASVIMIVNYDRKTFIVQATGIDTIKLFTVIVTAAVL
jgi:hypothetical protein